MGWVLNSSLTVASLHHGVSTEVTLTEHYASNFIPIQDFFPPVTVTIFNAKAGKLQALINGLNSF